jgi:hypothetical protein
LWPSVPARGAFSVEGYAFSGTDDGCGYPAPPIIKFLKERKQVALAFPDLGHQPPGDLEGRENYSDIRVG